MAKEVSREEQRKAAQERARKNFESRNEGGFSGKRILDLSKCGGYSKDLFYKPRDGVNHIDIVPYVIKTDRHPQGTKPGYTDYLLDVWVHRRVGPSDSQFLCLKKMFGQACPICEELDELKKDTSIDEEEINALRPKRRVWYNVINLDLKERDQKVQIFEEAHFLFEKELIEKAAVKKDSFVEFWDIEVGKSITFRATQKKSKKGNYFEYRIDEFEKRPKYLEDIYKETFSFDSMLVIPEYEEIRNAYHGIAEEPEQPKKETRSKGEDEEEPRKSSRRARDEEPEEEEPKKSRRAARDEEPEDENEKPRRRASREEPEDEEKPRRRTRDEEPEEEPEPKRRSRRDEEDEPSKKGGKSKCPEGLRFGHDNDKEDCCDTCDKELWNECADESDRLAKK